MITLTALRAFDVPIQTPCITPENFTGKSLAEIKVLPVTEGVRNLTLGDLFKIEETNDGTSNITINGDCTKVKRVGQAMKTVQSTVKGNIAMHKVEKIAGGKKILNDNS